MAEPAGRARGRLAAVLAAPWTWALVAFAARAAYALAPAGLDGVPWSDAADYHRLAARLAAGAGFTLGPDAAPYPTTFRPPLLPAVVAPFYALFGPRLGIGLLVQAALGALTVPVAAALARDVARAAGRDAGFAARAATASSVLVALWPSLVYFSGALLTETLAALLVTASLLLAVRLGRHGGARRALALGLVLALASLARPTALPLAAVLVGWIALAPARPAPARLREAALVAVALVAALAPWTARNLAVTGAFVPLTTGGGAALWDGNNPLVATDPRWRGGAVSLREVEPYAGEFAGMSELEIDRHAARRAAAFLAADPGRVPGLVAAKLARFFRVTSETPVSGQAAPAGSWPARWARAVDPLLVTWGLLLPFCAGALLVALARPRGPRFPLVAAVATQAALAAVYWGSLRFRAPVEPALIVLGVGGALAVLAALAPRAGQRSL